MNQIKRTYGNKKENKIKKVLIIATGALLNPIMVAQKLNIPSIAHAVMLEGGVR